MNTKLINQDHLSWLENEAIYIIREVIAQAKNVALLFSGGKDSVVLLHLACKAFKIEGKKLNLPFKLLHIDTGHNYQEVINFINKIAKELPTDIIRGYVEDSIKKGTVTLRNKTSSRNEAQAITLLETIEKYKFDALMGGARRDEEKSRAKERIFSFRDEFGQWDPKSQRPELWNLYNTKLFDNEHMRVFPISNWTEIDVWQYIQNEKLNLPSIYFAHQREVVKRNDMLIPLSEIVPKQPNEISKIESVRFRTVGDMSCTCPIASKAKNINEIIQETLQSNYSERSETRMDDRFSNTSLEKRKKAGYF